MPLITGTSPASFSKNVSTEMHEGKPLKQSLAIAYAMKKRAQHKAHGGMCEAHGRADCPHCYARGGDVDDPEEFPDAIEKENYAADAMDDRDLNQHGEEEVGARGMEDDNEPQDIRVIDHPVMNQDDVEDMVDRIMRQRAEHFSEGGKVANRSFPISEFEDNQFDDLVKRDDLEFSYTGANSGDYEGNEGEDERRRDIVSRIMRSRRLKDRLPSPA